MLTFTEAFLIESKTDDVKDAFAQINAAMDRASSKEMPKDQELDKGKVKQAINSLLKRLRGISEADDPSRSVSTTDFPPINTRRDISQTPKHKIDTYFIKRGIVPREDSGDVKGSMLNPLNPLVFTSLYRAIRRGGERAKGELDVASKILLKQAQELQKKIILALEEVDENPYVAASILLSLGAFLVDKKIELSHAIGHINLNVLTEMVATALKELSGKLLGR